MRYYFLDLKLSCFAARQRVIGPPVDGCHDPRQQGSSNHRMAFARQVDEIEGVVTKGDLLIVDDSL